MNDTKVQRYWVSGHSGCLISWGPEEGTIYITENDHARIVAEKDAEKRASDASNFQLVRRIETLTTLLAKYQRLHAADVDFDSGYSDVDVRVKRIRERRLAMEDLK